MALRARQGPIHLLSMNPLWVALYPASSPAAPLRVSRTALGHLIPPTPSLTLLRIPPLQSTSLPFCPISFLTALQVFP